MGRIKLLDSVVRECQECFCQLSCVTSFVFWIHLYSWTDRIDSYLIVLMA